MLIKSKFKASGIHLSISLLIFMVLVSFIYLVWYPQPYFAQAGGWQGIRIIAAVDLVLGPLLTFVVFNPEKARKLIVLDLSVIATLQILALTWGTYAVHSQRPIAVAYNDGHFSVVQADSLAKQDVEITDITKLSTEFPPLVYSRLPKDAEERAGIFTWEFIELVPQYELAFLFEPLAANFDAIEDSRDKISSAQQEKLNELLVNNDATQPTKVVPFFGFYGDAYLVISDQGKFIGSL